MNLLKVSFISAVETAVKLITALIVIKMLAIYSGPEGVARFGQFQNVLSILIILVSGSSVTGLVKYVSEIDSKPDAGALIVSDYFQGAFTFGVIASVLLSVLLVFNAEQMSYYVFDSKKYEGLFLYLSFGLIFIVFYQIAIAYLNGLRLIKEMIAIKLVASVFLLLCGTVLVYFFGLYGSLFALVGMQIVGGGYALWLMNRLSLFSWGWFKLNFIKKVQVDLSYYWLMGLVTLISTPVVLFFVRAHIATTASWATAGMWEAMWKISELSLMMVTTALTVYYVPMLSKSITKVEQLTVIGKVMLLALASASAISLFIYLFRDFFITLLFSSEFLEVSNILRFQLLGGIFRVAGWVIAFHMIVKAKPIFFITVELSFGLLFFMLSILFFDLHSLEGLTYAFLINNVLYCLFALIYLVMFYKVGKVINV
jgi:O-antigen/teichoic acid export membrane protein